MKLTWHLKKFDQLTLKEFWRICYLRIQVFVVEQNSPFQEIDRQDLTAHHLYATDDNGQIVAYARFFKNGANVSFGRVVIPKKFRGNDLGRKLIEHLLKAIDQVYGQSKIVIEAQYYVRRFYQKFGFRIVGKPFMDALRKHVKMIRD